MAATISRTVAAWRTLASGRSTSTTTATCAALAWFSHPQRCQSDSEGLQEKAARLFVVTQAAHHRCHKRGLQGQQAGVERGALYVPAAATAPLRVSVRFQARMTAQYCMHQGHKQA